MVKVQRLGRVRESVLLSDYRGSREARRAGWLTEIPRRCSCAALRRGLFSTLSPLYDESGPGNTARPTRRRRRDSATEEDDEEEADEEAEEDGEHPRGSARRSLSHWTRGSFNLPAVSYTPRPPPRLAALSYRARERFLRAVLVHARSPSVSSFLFLFLPRSAEETSSVCASHALCNTRTALEGLRSRGVREISDECRARMISLASDAHWSHGGRGPASLRDATEPPERASSLLSMAFLFSPHFWSLGT